MRVAIHQPHYFPYAGFFHKLSMVDALIIMDDAQYDKRFTNRNRILTPQGPIWLSVPINKAQKFMPNTSVEINNNVKWREEHFKKISYSYKNARYFSIYSDYLTEVFTREWRLLFDLDLETMKRVVEWLGIKVEFVRESELKVQGESTERLVNGCKAIGADTYVTGIGGKNYMDETLFEKSGIKLEYQHYEPKPYPQRFVGEFVPNLSIIDLIANMGPQSLKHITEGVSVGPIVPV